MPQPAPGLLDRLGHVAAQLRGQPGDQHRVLVVGLVEVRSSLRRAHEVCIGCTHTNGIDHCDAVVSVSDRAASRPHAREVAPGHNVVRERAFQSLKYEQLDREPIDDALDLVREADVFRVEFDSVRPHEALAWNRPADVHAGSADPTIPTFQEAKTLPVS